jgi:AraC family transcriptional regulator
MPSPTLFIHLSGKAKTRFTFDSNNWSQICSVPGDITSVAGIKKSRWKINGEVELLGFALAEDDKGLRSCLHRKTKYARAPIFEKAVNSGISDVLCESLLLQLLAHLEKGGGDDDYSRKLVETLLTHLSMGRESEVVSGLMRSVGKGPAYQIHQVISYIRDHLAEDLNIDKLSSIAGISPLYFSEAFKRHQGVTPHKYILQKRIDWAKELLLNTELSIAAIAQETGFSSQGHLTTTFSRLLGKTPLEFRKGAR